MNRLEVSAADAKWVQGLKRNLIVDRILHVLLRPIFTRLCSYTYEPYIPKSDTFLLAANHTTDFDQFLECIAVPGYIRYVAADNIFRWGLLSKLIVFLVHPIRKRKGADSHETIRAIEENLRLGINVGIHVEGNKSFTGRTGFISPRTGQMIKDAEGGLITFRITGGYMQKPRWARFRRRGPTYGQVVHEYMRQELDNMTADEINAILQRDLYVDASAMQRERPVAYPGRALAENLETALYCCPQCGRLQTMKSQNDHFFCVSCGYDVRIDPYGFFCGQNVRFDSLAQWDAWQRQQLRAYVEQQHGAVALLQNENLSVYALSGRKKRRIFKNARMCFYADRLEWTEGGRTLSVPLEQISGMAIFLKMTLMVTAEDGRYQVTSKTPYAALAYFAAYRYLTGKEYV